MFAVKNPHKDPRPQSILDIICKGGQFGVDEMAQQTQRSRDEIISCFQRLQQQKFPGFCFTDEKAIVTDPVELLKETTLATQLEASGQPEQMMQIKVFEEINSTNDYLLNQQLDYDTLQICAAEWQNRGRGRSGRDWQMPIASHLGFSFARQLPRISPTLNLLSLAAGVCVIQVLRAAGFYQVRLKWPNDIVIANPSGLLKTGGILVETRTRSQTGIKWVVGIGLNIANTLNFAESVGQPAIGLQQLKRKDNNKNLSRNKLLAEIIKYWFVVEARLINEPQWVIQKWRLYDMLSDQNIQVIPAAGRPFAGIAKGINAEGHLLVQPVNCNNQPLDADSLVPLSSGEVKVRVSEP